MNLQGLNGWVYLISEDSGRESGRTGFQTELISKQIFPAHWNRLNLKNLWNFYLLYTL